MGESQNQVNGFIFNNNEDFSRAKEEQEVIDHFKTKVDLSDPNDTLKLYNRFIEKNTFQTPVGYLFLKELQESILKSDIIKPEEMQKINYISQNPSTKTVKKEVDSLALNKYKEMVQNLKIKLRNSRIINLFFLVIVIAMIIIAIYSDKTVFTNFENEVIDHYASWEEELKLKENELEEREAKLNKE
ncbi:hypothetical protein KQI61_10575 [Anaerocolumna aminovalerica]|uniref:hypothetical protein n=1 Tax=Anaerocolumna aminovalerica TaxID=1527 RepID=UPI001C0EF31D|nr:hypothetical protein [Anaerocolumna aminovalerica]MBU5332646.1 hypothetical protein [Anaerocolumna aminovalerica]